MVYALGFPPGLFLGSGRYPITDLEGVPKKNEDGDGVFINALNFGQGKEPYTDPINNGGRTLTHEMGHFLGLLHTFSENGQCGQDSDYCNDTPPLSSSTTGCPSVNLLPVMVVLQ
jgi:Pregnancy-associated plasma protein-A